ncbi:hypothetical protein AAG906_027227 [Vitis piasezkii]
MVIASSHSLSRSSQKMRKSTSLSHKKPDQRREELQENRKNQLLSMPFPAHQSHHRPLLLLISLCLISSILQERQMSHHFHSITPRHSGGTTSSLFFNRFYHIEDNVQLGWGES